jgi:hypothetical protein
LAGTFGWTYDRQAKTVYVKFTRPLDRTEDHAEEITPFEPEHFHTPKEPTAASDAMG